jgi:hypothetical protein
MNNCKITSKDNKEIFQVQNKTFTYTFAPDVYLAGFTHSQKALRGAYEMVQDLHIKIKIQQLWIDTGGVIDNLTELVSPDVDKTNGKL